MNKPQEAYQQLCRHARDTKKLATTQALLEWDQQTLLPASAGPYRAEQTSFLAGLIHQRNTDAKVGHWLDELADSDLSRDRVSESGASIFHWRRQYEKQTRLPQSLVEALAHTCSLGQMAWIEARRDNDFKKFQPLLTRIVELKRQQADAIGFADCRYDALLDDYEPLAKTREIDDVLKQLRKDLVPLVQQINSTSKNPSTDFLRRSFPRDGQEKLGTMVATAIGFDFARGRLDTTKHPFCTELGPNDCRITTRYDEAYFPSAFFGILHEAGHGLYEQGLPQAEYGIASGDYCSLGMHESQSRLWENLVGRSRGFWEHFLPRAQTIFPEALGDVTLSQFYAAANVVKPSLIRVEADEATYNMHIIIRFELEQALLDDRLQVADLPQAWNDAYERDLGVRPPKDADGVLQDIHWSAGLMGYFPTYSLGNIYASQLFEQARKELGDMSAAFAAGEFTPLRDWLRHKVHSVGRRYNSRDLMQNITGRPIDSQPLIRHLRDKLLPIYGL